MKETILGSCPVHHGEWTVRRIEVTPSEDIVPLAEANQRTSGNWKYVLEHPGDQLCLRLDSGETLRESDALLESAENALIIAPENEWLNETKARIETLRYTCNAREDRLIVPLDAWSAEVVPKSDGGCVFTVTLGASESDIGRRATALLVLRAGGYVRIVRGFLAPPPQAKAGFMACVAEGYLDENLAAVLDALTVCCRHFAKAVSVLGNEYAAKRYLALSQTNPEQIKGELQTC